MFKATAEPRSGQDLDPVACLLAGRSPSIPAPLMSLKAHCWRPGEYPLRHSRMSELEGAFERISLDPAKLWGLFKVGDKGERASLTGSWAICISLGHSRSGGHGSESSCRGNCHRARPLQDLCALRVLSLQLPGLGGLVAGGPQDLLAQTSGTLVIPGTACDGIP